MEHMPRIKNNKDPLAHDLEEPLNTVEFEDPALAALAKIRHAMNIQVTEYDWHRALEAAREQDSASVSEVMRQALHEWLDRHPNKETIDSIAKMALEFELQAQLTRKAATAEKVPIQG
jgi:Arc/MetJ-type ribon-helix-helix transcriptional regulator